MASDTQTAQFLMNAQRIRIGLVLAMVGAVIGAVGSILAGVELAAATRKWFIDSGSSDVALNKVHQALHAGHAARHAAREAWMHNGAFAGSGAEAQTADRM